MLRIVSQSLAGQAAVIITGISISSIVTVPAAHALSVVPAVA